MQRNRLESLIKNTRRALSEFGRSLPLEQQQEINAALDEAEEKVDADDVILLQKTLSVVEEESNKLTEAVMTMA